jgi:signal transduction histidine kinase
MIGRHYSIFFPKASVDRGDPKRLLDESVQKGSASDIGLRLRKNGQSFWADSVISPLRDKEGHLRGFAMITRDVTERRQALKREKEALLEAETANRLKDEFLSTLSHELRTPLTAIIGWSRLLIDGDVTPDKQPEALATIARNARFQAQLIDDLLEVSRIITGKLRLGSIPASCDQ